MLEREQRSLKKCLRVIREGLRTIAHYTAILLIALIVAIAIRLSERGGEQDVDKPRDEKPPDSH